VRCQAHAEANLILHSGTGEGAFMARRSRKLDLLYACGAREPGPCRPCGIGKQDDLCAAACGSQPGRINMRHARRTEASSIAAYRSCRLFMLHDVSERQAVPDRFRRALSALINMVANGDVAAMRNSPMIRVGAG
jgi:hypothetical protein